MPDRKLENYLDSCRRALGRWFGISVEMPRVFFVQSRKDYDKLVGYKTHSWQVGNAGEGAIYILDPKIYTKESDHKDIKRFWLVLKHEYAHLYYRAITNNSKPKWLNEGLACYLAGQKKNKPAKEHLVNLNYFFSGGGQWVYGVGYFWVKYLIGKYGKTKLMKLIKTINAETTKIAFGKNFKKIYGFSLGKKLLKQRM